MKRIKETAKFIKHYEQRIAGNPALVEIYDRQRALFEIDSDHPKLMDHYLNWKMQGLRAFAITKDIRVVYQVTDKAYIFRDIGTHKQVYK